MWEYSQTSGDISHDGQRVATGYSGHAEGKNNPALQDHHDLGPCPRGRFKLKVITDEHGNWIDYEGKKAPVLRIIPEPGTEMFGRAGILMHGDSIGNPGTASLGCIIQAHWVRTQVANSVDDELAVTL